MFHRSAKLMPDAPDNSTPRQISSGDFAPHRTLPTGSRLRQLSSSVLFVLRVTRFCIAAIFYLASYVFLRWIPSHLVLGAAGITFPLWAVVDEVIRAQGQLDTPSSSVPQRPNLAEGAHDEWVDEDEDQEDVHTFTHKPNTFHNWRLKLLNLAIFLLVVDAAFSPYVRTSHLEHTLDVFRALPLGPTRARVHVRFPFPFGETTHAAALGGMGDDPFAATPEVEFDPAVVLNSYPLRIVYREAPLAGDALTDARWERGPLLRITETRDWTATATISDLWPATEYEWTVVFAHNHTRPAREQVHTFTTFPDPRMPRPKLPPPPLPPATQTVAVVSTSAATTTLLPTTKSAEFNVHADTTKEATETSVGAQRIIVEPVDEWNQTRPYPLVERPVPVRPASPPLDDPYHFVFGSASCVKADVPWNPLQSKPVVELLRTLRLPFMRRNRIKGLELLADRAAQGGLRFFLQLGDWIYADVPWFPPSTKRAILLSHYRNLYRRVYATLGWQRLAEIGLPFYGAADDHEVLNNWSGHDSDPKMRKAVRYGLQAWFEYVGMANPRATLGTSREALDEDEVDQEALDEYWNTETIIGELPLVPIEDDAPLASNNNDSFRAINAVEGYEAKTLPPPAPKSQADSAAPLPEAWYDFRYGDTAFFVFDARRYREPSGVDESASVLGQAQTAAFLDWLQSTNDSSTTFKFVISSFPFTSLWAGGWDVDARTDSWAAYLQERDLLLEKIASVPNVIVLSGDRHEFVAAALAPKKSEEQERVEGYSHWPVLELSTSPINMFYLPIPTANQQHGRGATGQEQLVKYLPRGNVKWTEFEVDTRDPNHPVVHVVLFIDGKPTWAADIIGTPVLKARSSRVQALGQVAKSLFKWLGFYSGS